MLFAQMRPWQRRRASLIASKRSRSDAVRHAILWARRETLAERAQAAADRLSRDPEDQAEMLAIQRFMGVAE
ncbi:MAG: hypothetical protein ACRDN9_10035 [Streptosporangiaceae bacterium]